MDISCFKSWAADYWLLKKYTCKHLSSHAVIVQEAPTCSQPNSGQMFLPCCFLIPFITCNFQPLSLQGKGPITHKILKMFSLTMKDTSL